MGQKKNPRFAQKIACQKARPKSAPSNKSALRIKTKSLNRKNSPIVKLHKQPSTKQIAGALSLGSNHNASSSHNEPELYAPEKLLGKASNF